MRKIGKALCLLLCCSQVQAQGFADTAKQLEQLYAPWKRSNGPGASVEVSRNGQVLWRWWGGIADLEHRVPVDSASIFEAGSVSKQFTTAAVLVLEEQGKLSLEDDIRKYFPELRVYARPIKVYHLLHHISGLRDWGTIAAVEGWERGMRAHTNTDVLAIIARQKELNNIPGAEYIYSNSNFNLLALLVERITKISFASFCRQQLFDPAGMPLTRWRNRFREVVPNRTIGYVPRPPLGWFTDMPFEDAHGNGGLLTTPHELADWAWKTGTGQFRGKAFRDKQWEKGRLNNGREIGYAAGLNIDSYRGHDLVTHSGATAGYRANLDYYPNDGLVIALESNDGSIPVVDMTRKIADVFFPDPKTPSPWPNTSYQPGEAEWNGIAGWYRDTRSNEAIQLKAENGKLKIDGREWTPTAKNTFVQGWRQLRLDTKGKDSVFYILNQPGAPDTIYWKKDKAPPGGKTYLQRFVGTYYSEEAQAEFHLTLQGDTLFWQRGTEVKQPMQATCLNGFSTPSADFYFNARADEFGLSLNRARNIRFRRKAR